MPIRPTFLEDILFLKMNRGPAPLFDLFGGGAIRAINIAVRLGIFDSINAKHQTAKELAESLGFEKRAISILLEFLCSLGYVKKRSEKYENTGITAKWISNDSQTSLSQMISVWNDEVFPFWDRNLESVMKNGEPTQTLYQEFDMKPESWKKFNAFEMAIANWLKDSLLKQIKFPTDAEDLLDIGGGHGLYSIMLCQKYPHLKATVFDREEPLKIARKFVESNDLTDRIQLRVGNFLTEDLGEGYDIALLFNIIHNFKKETNMELLKKSGEALRVGGSIVIFDNISGPGMSKGIVDFFSLAYLLTVGGQCYSLKELKDWLREARFNNVKTTFRLPGLVQATKVS